MKLMKFLGLSALALTLALSACGGSNESTLSEKNSDSGEIVGNICEFMTTDLLYSFDERSSFILVQLESVRGVFYRSALPGLLADYKVVTDYYHHLEAGTTVTIPFTLYEVEGKKKAVSTAVEFTMSSDSASAGFVDIGEVLDAEKLSAFLQENRRAFIYVSYSQYGSWDDEEGKAENFEVLSNAILLDSEYLPVGEDDALHLQIVYDFLDESGCHQTPPSKYIYGFSDFCREGMTLEELEENIENLYNQQKGK